VAGEIDSRQVEQSFSSFLAKFLPYLMILQSFAAHSVRSTLKKTSNMANISQGMKESLVPLALNPFFSADFLENHVDFITCFKTIY